MGQTIKSRNISLNFFEILACIMIIFIHAPFPGHIGEFITGLAKFGVPLFFAISGYYLYNEGITVENLRRKLNKRIKRILLLIILDIFIYLSILIFHNRNNLKEYFNSIISIYKIIEFLLFNHPLLGMTSWFLYAMLYAYVFLYIFAKMFLKNNFIIIFFICLAFMHPIVRIIMFKTELSFYGYALSSVILYLNWYFDALPCICLGVFLKKNKEMFEKINIKIDIVLIILFFILSGIAQICYANNNVSSNIHFSNIFCVSFIIIFTQKKPNLFSKLKFIENTGTWTMLVYILHPAMIFMVRKIVTNSFSEYLFPLVVAISTVIVVSAICYIIRIIKKRTQKNELTL
ncbi:MAG: acyltransferase [Clostridia bacterium]|nr:acyltransferase [Clostridia bacterium]